MNNSQIIDKTKDFVREALKNSESGHDWWHILRVYNLAKNIGAKEDVNMLTVELGALLHDIADIKFNNYDESIGPQKARDFLTMLKVDPVIVQHVEKIVANVSFKGENHIQPFRSPELDVVQDADRLDALGAIGIARAFGYGGYKNYPMFDPESKPRLNMTKEEYFKSESSTINHFYEKLLLLKDRMNTKTGKNMATTRHVYMEKFLQEFYLEWDGKL